VTYSYGYGAGAPRARSRRARTALPCTTALRYCPAHLASHPGAQGSTVELSLEAAIAFKSDVNLAIVESQCIGGDHAFRHQAPHHGEAALADPLSFRYHERICQGARRFPLRSAARHLRTAGAVISCPLRCTRTGTACRKRASRCPVPGALAWTSASATSWPPLWQAVRGMTIIVLQPAVR
jgi:hypothetical protein